VRNILCCYIVIILFNGIIFAYSILRKKGNLINHLYYNQKINTRKSDWILEKFTILVIIFGHNLLTDPIGNLIRFNFINKEFENYCYKNNKKCSIKTYEQYNIFIDLMMIIIIIFEIFCLLIFNKTIDLKYCNHKDLLFEIFGFVLFYRIVTIFFYKLNDLFFFTLNYKKRSYNRTLIHFAVNFIEITIAYTFYYTTDYFCIFQNNSSAIFKTLNVYMEWSVENIDNICNVQKLLLGSQIMFFILMFVFLINNLSAIKYTRDKDNSYRKRQKLKRFNKAILRIFWK